MTLLIEVLGGLVVAAIIMSIVMHVARSEADELRREELNRVYRAQRAKARAAKQPEGYEVPAFMREAANLHNLAEPDALDAKLTLMMVGNASVGELDDVFNNVQPKRRPGRPRKLVVH